MTQRQNSIFSSMVIFFTTSWSASISGLTKPFPEKLKLSSSFIFVRQTSSKATSGNSGTFTIEGNGWSDQGESTLKRFRAMESRNSVQKALFHISGMFYCAASAGSE
jgi:hypothetical protein